MKDTNIPKRGVQQGRRTSGRAQDDHRDDPYRAGGKPTEPSYCTQCGAVFHKGRWQWAAKPADATPMLCQACHRSNDKFPAGILTISGTFVPGHKAEVLALARHQETAEKQEHPMNRIMAIEEAGDKVVVNTTDIHLPRRIGEALTHAFQGNLKLDFDEDAYFLRATWQREQ